MKLKRALLATLAVLVAPGLAQASSWLQCDWLVSVERVESGQVAWRYERFLGSDGSARLDEAECRQQVPAGPVALAEITAGLELLAPGSRLAARWSSYSAMTPDGSMLVTGWQLRVME